MATTINADTSDGLKLTADTSGEIELQSAGTTIATVNSTGLAMASGKTITGAGVGVGKILQVVQAVKTDKFTTSSASFVDITGLSVTITPSSSSSKILVRFFTHISNSAYLGYLNLLRGSTSIIIGDAAGSRPRVTSNSAGYGDVGGAISAQYNATPASMEFLDSPNTTSATTYKLQTNSYSASYLTAINSTTIDRDATTYEPRSPSTITVMEVAG